MVCVRNRGLLVSACVYLLSGVAWAYIALRNSGRGLHPHGGEVLLPCVVGILFLISATVTFLSWMRQRK
jgi:hypothetical protein